MLKVHVSVLRTKNCWKFFVLKIFIPNTTFKGGQWLLTSELSIISVRDIFIVNVTKITNKQANVERSYLLTEKLVVNVVE